MSRIDDEFEVGHIRTDRGIYLDKGTTVYDLRHPDIAAQRDPLAYAVSLIGSDTATILLAPGETWMLTANLTIPANVTLDGRMGVIATNGFTLTVNGPVLAGNYQIFDVSGGGSVVFAVGSVDALRFEWFGAVGNSSTGDDATITAAITAAETANAPIRMGKRAYYTTTTIDLPRNVDLIGESSEFYTQIIPLAAVGANPVLQIDGSAGGGYTAFRNRIENVLFNLASVTTAGAVAVKLLSAYSVMFVNCYWHDATGKIVTVEDCNDISFHRCKFFGVATPDCTHGIHVIDNSTVQLYDPDIEVAQRGLLVEGDSTVEVYGPFIERGSVYGIEAKPSANGAVTVFGGDISIPSSGARGVSYAGQNINLYGTKLVIPASGFGLSSAGATTKPLNSGAWNVSAELGSGATLFEDTKNWIDRQVASTNSRHVSRADNVKSLDDNVATSIFRVVIPTANAMGYLDVDLLAQIGLTSTGTGSPVPYSLWTGRYRIAFSRDGAGVIDTAVVEYAKTNVDDSVNYSLTVAVAASISGNNLDIQVTANAGGASGDTRDVRVVAEATLVQTESSGSVYLSVQ